MNLSILDRIVLLGALPKQGAYITLKILTNLGLSLSFTEEELKKWNIQSDPETNLTTWDSGAGEVEIPIGEKAMDIIVDALKKLDQEKKLTPEMIDTYEKFIPTTE
jgi:hypothetical protein